MKPGKGTDPRFAEKEESIVEPARISPEEVRRKMVAGEPTLLVCAYDREVAFRKSYLDGAIALGDFQSRLPTLPEDHEIVFY